MDAGALDDVGDAKGFDCLVHERFKVASTVFALKPPPSRDQWEVAFDRAKAKQPGAWAPLIDSYDF
jgi:hypothetical protein